MGTAATETLGVPGIAVRSPLLKLQSDEKLIKLTRRGREDAYGVLVDRYRSRLLGFCQHMLRSREDAEDVLQEVYVAAYSAMCADERPIIVKPWLYRIARNRCLNHLRRKQPIPVESVETFEHRSGESAAEAAGRKEHLRQVVDDVQKLPESQRTALILREFDALSYNEIAGAMETTVPAVKSLL